MKTYEKKTLPEDEDGYFRWIGNKRLRLGKDLLKAQLNAPKAIAFYQKLVALQGEGWDDQTWGIAKAIAKGEQAHFLENEAIHGDEGYPLYVACMQDLCQGIIDIQPADAKGMQEGLATHARKRQIGLDILAHKSKLFDMVYPDRSENPAPKDNGQTLHQALDAYSQHLTAIRGEDLSGYMGERIKQANALKVLPDMPLCAMRLDALMAQLVYFADRPVSKKGKKISFYTARNRIKQLKDFWKWLDESEDWQWDGPKGWSTLRRRIAKDTDQDDRLLNGDNVSIWTIPELIALYKNATSITRLFILCGMNFGWGPSELGGLRAVHVPFIENGILRFIRPKTGVYGEFKIWPETQAALIEAWARRQAIPNADNSFVVSDKGKSLVKQTKGKNKSSRIPNLWTNLLNTCKREQPAFRRLSIKFLRKTGANLVRQFGGGEAMAIYLCHGKPVKTDDLSEVYSNKDFGPSFQATDKMRLLLAEMLAQ